MNVAYNISILQKNVIESNSHINAKIRIALSIAGVYSSMFSSNNYIKC